jgi:mediator of RNA polymerase II transcription subunit 21
VDIQSNLLRFDAVTRSHFNRLKDGAFAWDDLPVSLTLLIDSANHFILFTMSDRLTQLQDCLDQLLTQMYATVVYIDTHHSLPPIPGQADQWTPFSSTSATAGNNNNNLVEDEAGKQVQQAAGESSFGTTREPSPDPPALFQARLQELAQDLVVKEQQIEAIVESLPGLGSSKGAQEKRLTELEAELRQVEEQELLWEGERTKLLSRLDTWIVQSRVRRV